MTSGWIIAVFCGLLLAGGRVARASGPGLAGSSPAEINQASGVQTPSQDVPTLRDPFWPVGYWPSRKTPEEVVRETVKVPIRWPELVVKGRTKLGSKVLAVLVTGGVVEAGSTVRIEKEGVIYRFRVNAVTFTDFVYEKLDVHPAKSPGGPVKHEETKRNE